MSSSDKRRPMRKYFHVIAKHTFEELDDGLVRVTDQSGKTGVFRWDGRYIEGELTQCNRHMLMWTGGPYLPRELNYRWTEVPVDIARPSGWPEELETLLSHQLGRAPGTHDSG
jgi:hypothetical protein